MKRLVQEQEHDHPHPHPSPHDWFPYLPLSRVVPFAAPGAHNSHVYSYTIEGETSFRKWKHPWTIQRYDISV